MFEHASGRMLRYFVPITIIATPLGQLLGDQISTDMVEAVGGILVSFVAVFEVYQKRQLFASWFCFSCKNANNLPETFDVDASLKTLNTKPPSNLSMTSSGDSSDASENICDKPLSDDYNLMGTVSIDLVHRIILLTNNRQTAW